MGNLLIKPKQMKFAVALVAVAAATSQEGLEMLHTLEYVDQSTENLEDVRSALVMCAAAGDCSEQVDQMPTLAMASKKLDFDKLWKGCVAKNGVKYCEAKVAKGIAITKAVFVKAKAAEDWEKVKKQEAHLARLERVVAKHRAGVY